MPIIPAQRHLSPPLPGHVAASNPTPRVAPPNRPTVPAQRQGDWVDLPLPYRPVPPARPQAQAQRAPAPAPPAGNAPRHRRDSTRLTAAVDVVGRVGSAVSLAALLVVAAAVGGLADGQPTADSTSLTITFDSAE